MAAYCNVLGVFVKTVRSVHAELSLTPDSFIPPAEGLTSSRAKPFRISLLQDAELSATFFRAAATYIGIAQLFIFQKCIFFWLKLHEGVSVNILGCCAKARDTREGFHQARGLGSPDFIPCKVVNAPEIKVRAGSTAR